MVQAIDNTNLLNYCNNCGAIGFVPSLSYTYNAGTGAVVVTNSSTIPAGDTLTKVHVRLIDKFGKEVRGVINVGDDPQSVTLSASTLNTSRPLILCATILTAGQIAADGSAYWLNAAGILSGWDVQKNA